MKTNDSTDQLATPTASSQPTGYAGSFQQTKTIVLYTDLFPGWETSEYAPWLFDEKHLSSTQKPPNTIRVKVLVPLPIIKSEDLTVQAISEPA